MRRLRHIYIELTKKLRLSAGIVGIFFRLS
jgi:hypothetical protein